MQSFPKARTTVFPMALALACATCGGPQRDARSRVARVQPVTVGRTDYDTFFRAVYGMQIAVNEAERDRVDLLAHLGDALELGSGATLDAIGAAVRARVTSLPQGTTLHIATRPPRPCQPPEQATGEAWNQSAHVFPESQSDAEHAVALDLRVDGASPPEVQSLEQALSHGLRSALALQARMDEIVAFAPSIRTAGARLTASAPHDLPTQATALRPELRDAIQFLDGIGARACAESEVAFRITVRLTASADATIAQ